MDIVPRNSHSSGSLNLQTNKDFLAHDLNDHVGTSDLGLMNVEYDDDDDDVDDDEDDDDGYDDDDDVCWQTQVEHWKKFQAPKEEDIQAQFDSMDFPPGVEASVPWFQDPGGSQEKSAPTCNSLLPDQSTTSMVAEEKDDVKESILFKQFDIVEDYSDHHYSKKFSSNHKPSKTWSKKIQGEWKILEENLPDTIFVRAYEGRMDLMRAVIAGAAGTPYHDGLFFFDIFFPDAYPNVPPEVYYHSHGLRLNPNLYNCGKVCLSLLNTWSGINMNEMWSPHKSTVLQVLVSIQALVLNAKPYFNEPGIESTAGTPYGEERSQRYNENTFILSLKTMLFTLRRTPKHFEDFVKEHFRERAHDILLACKAYAQGGRIGCLVKGEEVQDFNPGGRSCPNIFRPQLANMVKILVPTFTRNGSHDCEQFLY